MKQLFTTLYGNPKIAKSNNTGIYNTRILHLAPEKLSGYNVCPWASPGCLKACLNKSGHGQTNMVQRCRVRRTQLLFEDKLRFRELLYANITSFVKACQRIDIKPAVRLNGTSDVAWEEKFNDIFVRFPQVMFYDYTKSLLRALTQQRDNYHLTFSRTECNDDDCLKALRAGVNVAVVFDDKKPLPAKWKRFKVFDGNSHDLRFLDPKGVCGLHAKGKAKKDTSGFVVRGVS
jgi:hypothetical protein